MTTDQQAPAQPLSPEYKRLSVNLGLPVAAALKEVAAKQGINVTEAVRRAISLLKAVDDAQRSGGAVVIYPRRGSDRGAREITLL